MSKNDEQMANDVSETVKAVLELGKIKLHELNALQASFLLDKYTGFYMQDLIKEQLKRQLGVNLV